jgi:hypothetical protein
MSEIDVDTTFSSGIMSPEEVAQFLRKSPSWVYKNWKILGGRKLGGSLFFPRKEDLYERLFGKGQGVEVRLHPERDQVHGYLIQDKKRGQNGRSKKKGGTGKTERGDGDPNRHGLLGVGQ